MISVILIATDGCDVIDATVESVLAQTMSEWELIIVDNGSNDDTLAYARRWAEYDPRITAITIQRTTASMARQTGVERAAKQWITFVTAGDKLSPEAFEWLTAHMSPEVSMVVGGITRTTDSGSYALRSDYSGLLDVPKFINGLLDGDFAHEVGGKLFRHELYLVPDILADTETSRHHQLMTIVATLPRDGQVYVNTSHSIYESSDTGLDYPQVMNFRGWIKTGDILSRYVPQSQCLFLFKLHALYRGCIMQGAMFGSSHPAIKALRAESKRYQLSGEDRKMLRLLRSRGARRRAWARVPLVPSAGEIMITMIMAAYNDADLMTKAIKSLQSQTFLHWELLIVDSSSSDRTPEIMRSIGASDPRIRWVRTSKAIGRYRCSRLGIAAARGEYIGFINPDDVLGRRSLEMLWERASATDADMVVMGTQLRSSHGWLRFPQFNPSDTFDSPVMTTYEVMSQMLTARGMPWHQYGRIYRRSYLRRADLKIDDDDNDDLLNLLAMLTEGTVAWTDYQGYINLHTTMADLPLTEQWRYLVRAYNKSRKLLDDRLWAGHAEWRADQAKALGSALIEKISGALRLESRGSVLKCLEEALSSPAIVEAVRLAGYEPTVEAVLRAATEGRKQFRKAFLRHRLLQIF